MKGTERTPPRKVRKKGRKDKTEDKERRVGDNRNERKKKTENGRRRRKEGVIKKAPKRK